jgi:hypothetical protein
VRKDHAVPVPFRRTINQIGKKPRQEGHPVKRLGILGHRDRLRFRKAIIAVLLGVGYDRKLMFAVDPLNRREMMTPISPPVLQLWNSFPSLIDDGGRFEKTSKQPGLTCMYAIDIPESCGQERSTRRQRFLSTWPTTVCLYWVNSRASCVPFPDSGKVSKEPLRNAWRERTDAIRNAFIENTK